MRKLFTLIVMLAFTGTIYAQLERMIDFEEGMADTAWIPFANGPDTTMASLQIMYNPWIDALNPSDSVMAFYVKPESDRWVGMYTDYDVLTEFTAEAYTLALMIWKPMVSPVGMKIERSLTGSDNISYYTSNTFTEEWELLTFDFTEGIAHYFERLTIFPDFPETADISRDYLPTYVYIDNIGVPSESNSSFSEQNGIEMMLYPTPAEFRMAVAYPGMSGITLTDVTGRRIRSMKFSSRDSKVIETGDLKTGIYFVTADTQDGPVTMKFLKK